MLAFECTLTELIVSNRIVHVTWRGAATEQTTMDESPCPMFCAELKRLSYKLRIVQLIV